MVNKVILIGNVGADPAVREVGDTKVAELSLATTENWKDKDGNKQSKTEWHNLVFWRGLAGVVENWVKKGAKIYVEGKLQYQSWDKDDGTKGYKTIVQVTEMKMLGGDKPAAPTSAADIPPAPTGGGIDATDNLPF